MNVVFNRSARALVMLAFFGSLSPVASAADKPDASSTMAIRLIDSETRKPVAGARVIFASSWDPSGTGKRRRSVALSTDPMALPQIQVARKLVAQASPPGVPIASTDYEMSDADGRVESGLPAGDVTLTVMNERGIVFLKEDEWSRQDGDVRVKLNPWASLSGTVTRRGKPAAGVDLTISRVSASASVGAMMGMYMPPLTHHVTARTDNDGKFSFARLLPTTLDTERDVPYVLSETITHDPPPSDEEMKTAGVSGIGLKLAGRDTISFDRGSVPINPGERKTMNFEITPRCERIVTGRLVWADGSPVEREALGDGGAASSGEIGFWPNHDGSSSGTMPRTVVDADGRFSVKVPIAGRWTLTAGTLRPVGQNAQFEFDLPDAGNETGKGQAVDLGEIVFHRPGVVKAAPKPDAKGRVEIVFTVLDERHKPLEGAKVKIERLESNMPESSRWHYPKNPPGVRSGAGGVVRLQVLVNYRDEDGKDWRITNAGVNITMDGYEPLSRSLALGESGSVVAMKESLSVALRVTRDGKAMPLDRVQIGAGWTVHGWNPFEHSKWKGDERLVLRRVDVPQGVWQVQAGHIDTEKWRWFSRVAEVDAAKRNLLAELVLQRGARVGGEIDRVVPRPVRNGIVRVMVRMPPPTSQRSWPIFWSDWQPVDERGEFSFRGLPAGDAWIAASCDGWISEEGAESPKLPGDPNWEEGMSINWRSRPFRVEETGAVVTVPMTRAGTVVFHFKNRDGTPLAGAHPWADSKLKLGPDQESLESTNRSLDHLLTELDENGYTTGAFLPRLVDQTDESGVVRLANLPPARVRIGMWLQNVKLRPARDDAVKSDHPHDHAVPFQADVKPGEVVEKEFVVERW